MAPTNSPVKPQCPLLRILSTSISDLAPPRKNAGLFSFCRCYAWRMPQDDRRPEPQWRLLVIVLCWGVVLAALGLLLRWWGF